MKEIALGTLCLAGLVAASGCAGGGSTAGVLPSAVGSSQAGKSGGASIDDVFVVIEESAGSGESTSALAVRRRVAPSFRIRR